ncbi:SUN domain-containing protein 2-like [Pangasianodon hypophthalmus]|uniref:SUN domain-containing protein 2-like n=1 Tax=Pangasianodon hypophthalmus TaxID=310915 RepID=UPI002307532B|nr:SUN domain-containing protein 2-like [Pangasianodon hypophthalmus]
MSRRSPRLSSKGYYNPDDHAVRQISYKETPIRIFRKRKRKHRVGGACHNLINEFNMCDFQSLETQDPMLTSETPPQHDSPPCRCCLVVRTAVPLPLLLLLLGFGVWFCYTSVTKWPVQPAVHLTQDTHTRDHAALFKEIDLLKQVIMQQRLEKEEIEEIVRRALSRHRADDIGMADYALESLGAAVVASTATHKTRYCKLFRISMWCRNNGPETVIQPEVYPGKCWGFKGSQGHLVISLSYPVHITHVTLEHLPRVLSPTGHIRSAPRDFAVYGMVNEKEEGNLLGKFTYDQDGDPIQTFELPDSPSEVFGLVKLKILSNWGHAEYTCVYRFRVHSRPRSR